MKVKNESPEDIVLGQGAGAVTISAGSEEELEGRLLSTDAFAEALAEGRLRFILTPNPGEEKVRMARRILPKLIRHLAPRFIGLGSRLESSVTALEQQRRKYNHSWKQTEFLLKAVDSSASGAKNLLQGARHFALNVKPEQAAEDAIQAELAALLATDPDTIEDLPTFLEQVKAKEGELAQAVAKREAADAQYVKPFQRLAEQLDAVAESFEHVDPAADIGKEVPPFPE